MYSIIDIVNMDIFTEIRFFIKLWEKSVLYVHAVGVPLATRLSCPLTKEIGTEREPDTLS